MDKFKHIHLRLDEKDAIKLEKVVKERGRWADYFSKTYGKADALREGLNLLYEMTIEENYKIVPLTEEEKQQKALDEMNRKKKQRKPTKGLVCNVNGS